MDWPLVFLVISGALWFFMVGYAMGWRGHSKCLERQGR